MKIKLHLLFFSSMVLCCFFEIKSSNIKTVTLPEVSFTSPLVPTIFDLYVDSTLKTLEDPQNNYYIYISFKRYNKTNEPYPYVFISVAQKEFFYPIKIKGYTTYRDIFVFVSGNMSDCFTKEESNLKEFKYSKYRGLYEGCMEWWFQIVGDTIKLVNHIDWRKPWQGFNGLGWYDNRARVLDALTGRFTTPDPLAERYPWESPYLFCSGNPVKMVDEDGKDGIVSIYGPKISISANIYLYGIGANSYVRDTFQSGINSKWSNRTYSIQHNNKVFQTSVEGNVYLQRGLYPIGRFSPWDRNNYVYVSDDIKTSTVNNYGIDYNEWRSRGRNGESLSQDNPAPHEFGHLLGLPDMFIRTLRNQFLVGNTI